MKRGAVGLVVLAVLFLSTWSLQAAEEPKGLPPGWLSLDSTVGILDKKIEDGKGVVEKALGISISGFFDAGYTWSSNRPDGKSSFKNIGMRYFDQNHNQFDLNFFNLTIEKPEKDWGVGFKIVGDFGRSAELLREATFWGANKFRGFPASKAGGEPSAELREAFLTTTIPIGEGLQVKAGKFVTPLGTEIIPAPGAYNDNISRSYLFNFGIPLTHTGALFTYQAHKILSVSAGPVTGWDNPIDNNGAVSFLGGFNLTPTEAISLASNVIFGAEQRNKNGPKRLAWSNVLTLKPTDPLTLYLEYTYGREQKVTPNLRDATWQGVSAIASYNWTDRFNTALRGEWFHDADGIRGFPLNGQPVPKDTNYGEITLTAAYKFTAKLLGRFEVRQDWADENTFVRRSTAIDKAQTTIAFQGIYGF
jgi:hypothetical protein